MMINEKMRFNKEDWSGEMAEILVTEVAGVYEWSQNGYDLKLAGKTVYDSEDDGSGKFVWTMYDIYVDGQRRPHKVGKFGNDDLWTATNELGDMDRLGSNPVIAASRLMFNLL